jgi:hypothetical protein
VAGEGFISSRDLADAVASVNSMISGLRHGAETMGVLPPVEELTLALVVGAASDKIATTQLSGMLAVSLLRLATNAEPEP